MTDLGTALRRPPQGGTSPAPSDAQTNRLHRTSEQIRRAILVKPDLAVRYLKLESVRRRDPVVLLTLRAEAHLRAREADAAFTAPTAAIHAADEVGEPLLTAAAVQADVCCLIGEPSALQACEDHQQLASALHDADRVLTARALHAVIAYQQHDCAQGATEPDQAMRLCRGHNRDDPRRTEADAARKLMVAGCMPAGYDAEQATRNPVPEGKLQRQAAAGGKNYVTSRLLHRPSHHACRAVGTLAGLSPATGTAETEPTVDLQLSPLHHQRRGPRP